MNDFSVIDAKHVFDWFLRSESRILTDFGNLIAVDTSLGKEPEIFGLVEEYTGSVGFKVRREPMHPDIRKSFSFSPHPASVPEAVTQNLRAELDRPALSSERVLFNCHIDVVPTTDDFPNAFTPKVIDGRFYGRGACDTKNNLVMLVEALRYLEENKKPLTRDVSLDMPSEEEIGGNGTLSTILYGTNANEVVVLEPTNLSVYRGHRGCLTFSVSIGGHAVHMGSDATGISAIKAAYNVMNGLEKLEADMLAEAKKDEAFNVWARPLQLNVGLIQGGEWPGSVPEHCEITCNIGFLPAYSLQQMEEKVRTATAHSVAHLGNVRLDFDFACGLRNDAYIQSAELPLVQRLQHCANSVLKHTKTKTHGWRVSCDGRLYDKVAKVPTVVFGSGDLSDAHSAHENVELKELAKGIAILADFLSRPQSMSNTKAHRGHQPG